MRRRSAVAILAVMFMATSCDRERTSKAVGADARQMVGSVVAVEAVGIEGLAVRLPGRDTPMGLRERQPIPAGSVVEVPWGRRATIDAGGTTLTLDHGAQIELHDGKAVLRAGQVVIRHDRPVPYQLHVPTGSVVLPAGRLAEVSALATAAEGSFVVRSGEIELPSTSGDPLAIGEGRELVLTDAGEALVAPASELATRFGWSTLVTGNGRQWPRGFGSLTARDDEGKRHRLSLERHEIDVRIVGNVAFTKVTETFHNDTRISTTPSFRFPLPAGAAPIHFGLRIGDEEARAAFRADEGAVDGSGGERAGGSWIEASFPMRRGVSATVVLEYVEVLRPTATGYAYTYPMPVDVDLVVGEVDVKVDLPGHDASQRLTVLGYETSVEHGVEDADGSMTRVSMSASDFFPAGDLTLRIGRGEVSAGVTVYSYAEEGEGRALLTLRPSFAAPVSRGGRDFVLVIDTSSSQEASVDAQLALVREMVAQLSDEDRVLVLGCAETCRPLSASGLRSGGPSAADELRVATLELTTGGASYLLETARVVAAFLAAREGDERPAHLVWLTDGAATLDDARTPEIEAAVKRALQPHDPRTTLVDLGGEGHAATLGALARATDAVVVPLAPAVAPSVRASEMLSGHDRPLLEDLAIDLPEGVTLDSPLPAAIRLGEELVLAVRFTGEVDGTLQLSGRVVGEAVRREVSLALEASTRAESSFVPRVWAWQRVRGLEWAPRSEADDDELVRLSRRYGVPSQRTRLAFEQAPSIVVEHRAPPPFALEEHEQVLEESEPRASLQLDNEEEWRRVLQERRGDKEREKPERTNDEATADAPAPLIAMPFVGDMDEETAEIVRDSMPEYKGPMKDQVDGWMGAPTSSRKRRKKAWRPPPIVIRATREPTKWEESFVLDARREYEAEPEDRGKRLRLVRAQMRAREYKPARALIEQWLASAPRDAEAWMQLAQLEAYGGDVDAAFDAMMRAIEAAPTSPWILERVRDAARSDGDEALACATDRRLRSIRGRGVASRKDPCPLLSDVDRWLRPDAEGATEESVAEKSIRAPKGALVASLEVKGKSDWDLALIEPHGRLLWWGSRREDLRVAGVRGASREYLALPENLEGTYSIVVIPRAPDTETSVIVEVVAGKEREEFARTVKGPTEIAEVQFH